MTCLRATSSATPVVVVLIQNRILNSQHHVEFASNTPLDMVKYTSDSSNTPPLRLGVFELPLVYLTRSQGYLKQIQLAFQIDHAFSYKMGILHIGMSFYLSSIYEL